MPERKFVRKVLFYLILCPLSLSQRLEIRLKIDHNFLICLHSCFTFSFKVNFF